MNAQLLWILFFLKISAITTYGVLWLWAKQSRIKNAAKSLEKKGAKASPKAAVRLGAGRPQ